MSVPYHKITPIYQCLDKGDWKGAVKICQRKDLQGWDITKSLMAYSLSQLNKNEQALDVALDVKRNEPTDEGTLSALTLTFKAMGRHQDALECYENASKKCPDNETLAIEALNCYAGIGDFKKLQQGAQKMFKLSGNSKYIFWSASCILLQDSPLTMLDLAEKMLDKALDGDKKNQQPGAEEIGLLVAISRKKASNDSIEPERKCDILERCLDRLQVLSSRPVLLQIHDESTVKVREGGDGSLVKSHPQHLYLLKIQILQDLYSCRLERLSQCQVEDAGSEKTRIGEYLCCRMIPLIKELLKELPDQWNALKALVEAWCEVHRLQQFLDASQLGIVPRIGSARRELLILQSSNSSTRGPYLAEIYLLQEAKGFMDADEVMKEWAIDDISGIQNLTIQFSNNIQDDPVQQEMIRLLAQYISRFDSKQCCFSDLKPYLDNLCDGTHIGASSAATLQLWVRDKAKSLIRDFDNLEEGKCFVHNASILLCRISKVLQIDKYISTLGLDASSDVLKPLLSVTELLNLYCKSYSALAGKGIGGLREVQPGDELLMLCSNSLWQRVQACSSSEEIVSCLEWAEKLVIGLEASPHNYCFPLESFEVLRRLSCVEYALNSFNKLEIKYTQLDSLSYLILPTLLEGGLFLEFHRLSNDIIKFHEGAQKDTLSNVGKCLKNANYAKSLELGKFAKKCKHSLQLALARAEFPLLEVLENKHSVQEVLSYFKQYVGGEVLESQTILSDKEIDDLYENMDYNLLVSMDGDSKAQNTDDVCKQQNRRQQYKNRIISGQFFLRLILAFMEDGASSSFEEQLRQRWQEQFGTLDGFEGSNASKTVGSSKVIDFKWSQKIDYGSADFERTIWMLLYRMLAFCSKCIKNIKSIDVDEKSLKELQQFESSALQSLSDVRLDVSDSTNRYVVHKSSNVLLQPSWIRKMSAAVRLVSCWGSIILASARLQMGGDIGLPSSKSAKKKKNKKGQKRVEEHDDSHENVLHASTKKEFLNFAGPFRKLSDEMSDILTYEMETDSRSNAAIFRYLDEVLTPVQTDSEEEFKQVVDENGKISSRSAKFQLAEKMLSSQTLSCTRLFDAMQKKTPLMGKIDSEF